ncbi:hypothetical protein BL254_01070 [Protofrankia sp. BMG5.30]|nr:hypothetical protein BL254_01070 [Protofrankia sp. BMG5.30]
MAVAAMGGGLAVLLLGACGEATGTSVTTGSTGPTGSVTLPSGLPTSLPTGLPTALPSISASLPGGGQVATGRDALKAANVPEDFPIPPGAEVEAGTSRNNESVLTLSGVSDNAVATFYRQALPAAGYTITSDNQIAGLAASIAFEGHGLSGTIGTAGIGTANGTILTFRKQ